MHKINNRILTFDFLRDKKLPTFLRFEVEVLALDSLDTSILNSAFCGKVSETVQMRQLRFIGESFSPQVDGTLYGNVNVCTYVYNRTCQPRLANSLDTQVQDFMGSCMKLRREHAAINYIMEQNSRPRPRILKWLN